MNMNFRTFTKKFLAFHIQENKKLFDGKIEFSMISERQQIVCLGNMELHFVYPVKGLS